MKKILSLVLAGLLCLSLAACGHTHVWEEATCTDAKTCTECGETEGEALGHQWKEATCVNAKTCSVCGAEEGAPLGHNWLDATCTDPKTCTVCGETEGEALGHNLTEANYQDAPQCTICGAVEGEPLQADFDKYGIAVELQEGVEVPYTTTCYQADDEATTGTVKAIDYRIYSSDEDHPEKEGYEWRSVTLQLHFFDDSAYDYGFTWSSRTEDFYDIKGFDDTGVDGEEESRVHTVNFHGEDHEVVVYYSTSSTGWLDHEIFVDLTYDLLVPVEFDGMVIGVYDNAIARELEDNPYLYEIYTGPEDYHFFRLK